MTSCQLKDRKPPWHASGRAVDLRSFGLSVSPIQDHLKNPIAGYIQCHVCHVLPVHLSKDIKFGSKWYECMWSSSHFIQLFPRRSRRARNTRHPSPPMRKMTPTRIAVTCTCDLSRAFMFGSLSLGPLFFARHEGKLRQCFLARLNYLFCDLDPRNREGFALRVGSLMKVCAGCGWFGQVDRQDRWNQFTLTVSGCVNAIWFVFDIFDITWWIVRQNAVSSHLETYRTL